MSVYLFIYLLFLFIIFLTIKNKKLEPGGSLVYPEVINKIKEPHNTRPDSIYPTLTFPHSHHKVPPEQTLESKLSTKTGCTIILTSSSIRPTSSSPCQFYFF
jgi:hypothetical protein